jgi:hypothetical protein
MFLQSFYALFAGYIVPLSLYSWLRAGRGPLASIAVSRDALAWRVQHLDDFVLDVFCLLPVRVVHHAVVISTNYTSPSL